MTLVDDKLLVFLKLLYYGCSCTFHTLLLQHTSILETQQINSIFVDR
jgi:hypothetical protein